MEKTNRSAVITECAILIAMAFILSFISIIRMPYGGAVTAASMFPIIVAGYRHGLKWGIISGFAYSILQLIVGLQNISYATSAMAAVAIIMLDYVAAFTLLGLVGIFKRSRHQTAVLVVGTLVVCIIRFICHFITGCTVWAGVSIPGASAMIYSLIYNAAYMVPETVVTVYVAALLSNALDLRQDRLVTRKKSEKVTPVLSGALVFGAFVVVDFIYIFAKVQSSVGFDITLIKNVSVPLVTVLAVIGAVLGIAVYCISKAFAKKKTENVD